MLQIILEKITKIEIELALFKKETGQGLQKVHERLDKQGKQLAYLEDDAPTREEHDVLKKRVKRLEQI